METIELPVAEIKEKIVAIVRFGPSGYPTDGFRAGEYYQVTIDPKCISPSGKFIRFGHVQGDEIMGWQRAEALTVVEILGKWENETSPLLNYGNGESVNFLVLPAVKKTI